MNQIIPNRKAGLVRSLCAGPGGMMARMAANIFRADGIHRCPRPFNFSPVRIIRKLPSAHSAPAGLRNKSNQPHRNRMSTASRWRPPALKAASRHAPPGWPEIDFQAEFIGLKRSRQRK